MCILLSFGHKLGRRIAGAVSTHMLSFDIAKQCMYHFTLVSVMCDNSSCSSPTLGMLCVGHIGKLCPVFQHAILSKSYFFFFFLFWLHNFLFPFLVTLPLLPLYKFSFSLSFKGLFIYLFLFLAVLGLHCCAWLSLVVAGRGYSSLWCPGFSLWWLLWL